MSTSPSTTIYCWHPRRIFCSNLGTYLLTTCSRVLLETLTNFQVVRNSPHFMEAEVSLLHSQVPATWPYSEPAWSSPYPTSHFLKIHLNTILPFRPGLPSGFFPSSFPTKTLYTHMFFDIHATCPAHLILLDFITHTILGEQYRSLRSSLCSFLLSLVTSTLLCPKYSPQNCILKYPQPMFLPQCELPSFTPIQNNRQNYSSVYLNL